MEHKVINQGKKLTCHISFAKVKNINLRIKADGMIYISVNPKVPIANIDAFIISKWDWILKTQDKLRSRKNISFINDRIYFLGKPYHIEYKVGHKRILINDNLTIYHPNLNDKEGINKSVSEYLVKRLEQLVNELRPKLDKIMDDYHHPYPQIAYRRMTSRWGSCMVKKNKITLNSYLIHYPKECIYYVLLHEYLHFVVANHSKRFYDLMSYHLKDHKRYKQILDSFSVNSSL